MSGFQSLLSLLGQFPQLVAPIPMLLTALAIRLPVVPFEGKTKASILASLLVTAVLVEFLIAWLTGQLASWDAAKAVKLLGEAWSIVAVAFATHTVAKETVKAVVKSSEVTAN